MTELSVLFANDDVLTQWVMADVLVQAGFQVESACRSDQVIALLGDSPEFDLLITEVDLPDCTGVFDVGYFWRRARPGRPVIYTGATRSGLTQPLQYNETFLPTPFSAASLLRAIDRSLAEVSFRPVLPAASRRMHHVH